jgi:type II secretory pathway pseudopilin PulG
VRQTNKTRKTTGLTVIEVLIALALLGVMVGFVANSLAGSFKITRENRKSLDATSAVQRVVESVRGQWQSRGLYGAGCAELTLNQANSSFMSIAATVTVLNAAATITGSEDPLTTTGCTALLTTGTCTALAQPMKRLIVTATDAETAGRELSKVTLDLVCPVNP